MVRSTLVGALVMFLVVACARPNNIVQLAPPSPTPTPSPSPTPTAPLQASSAPFHVGEVGIGYGAVALSAIGGVQPYTWSISAGALPDGLTLGSDGSVAGTPSSAGNFSFTIQVADSGGSTATVSGKIGIAAHLSAGLIAACATQCSVEIGCVSVCGAFGQISGGVGPYSYTQTSGQVPAGTALSGLSLTGTFTGLSGFLQFSVQVTDSLGATAIVAPTFWMYKHISLAGSALCKGDFNTPCRAVIPYSGGTPGGVPKVHITGYGTYCVNFCYPKPSSPPPSFVLSVGGGNVVASVRAACGYVPGAVANGCPTGWGGILYLDVSDQNLCAASTYCVSGTSALSIEIVTG